MISDMITALLAIMTIAALVALLERNHRRTAGLPRAPFGADAPDRDLDRVLHDARTVRSDSGDGRTRPAATRDTKRKGLSGGGRRLIAH
jgi:hypothetical protein